MNQLHPKAEPNPRKKKATDASQVESARQSLLFVSIPRSKSFWTGAALAILAVAGVALFLWRSDYDWSAITRAVDKLNPIAVIPLMAVLPVFGFPIALVYLVAGARFGPVGGGLVVAAITAFHLLATHAVAQSFLRGPIQRFVEKRHRRLPQIPADEHDAIAVIAALAPGLPYVLRNYILALSGVRLRVYFWICLPIYVARSYVTILLGDFSNDPSGRGIFIIVAIDVLKVSICGAVIWWLRRRHRRRRGPIDVSPGGVSAQSSGATSK
ncbi:MAG: hypothetical protein ABIZ49_05715 [Opitutaceae bacterium]